MSGETSHFPTGQAISDFNEMSVGLLGVMNPLVIKDLACPTWGVGMSTSADGTLVPTVGSPFLPLIIPPTEAFTLDPTWSAICTRIMNDPLQSGTFMIFDPPTVLTPASNMVAPPRYTPAVAQASPTTAPESQPTASAILGKPASPPTNHGGPPVETEDPVVGSKASSTGPATAEPSPLISDPSPGGPSDPASVPNSGSDNKFASDGSNGQASDLQIASTPLIIGGHTLVYSPSGLVIDGQPLQPGSIALTISNTPISLGHWGFLVYGSSSILLPSQSIFVIGSQTFTANPTGFALNAGSISPGGAVETTDNTAISAGGPAVTVDGTIVSLGPSEVLAIGSSTFTLPMPTPAASVNQPLVIAGQTITPNGPAFSIAGTTLSPGGPAIIINGTIVSLQPYGTLVVGSNSFALPTPSFPTYDIGGFSVQDESSFAVVDGVTVDPGAAGVTIGGSVVSLELGGKTLDVGSGRFAMPTSPANGTNGLQMFQGGQGRCLRVSLPMILGCCVFLTLMLC